MAFHFSQIFPLKTKFNQVSSIGNINSTQLVLTFARLFCDKKDKRPQYIPECPKEDENPERIQKHEAQPLEMPEEPMIPCCMTGCPNCVWLEYAEALEKYFKDGGAKAVKEIDEKVKDPMIKAYLLTELRIRKMDS